jgi:hypothetical protein
LHPPYSQELAEFDAKLRDQYRRLKSARGTDPVFIIEHGLEAPEVLELQALVGRKLRLLRPGSAAWIGNHLSLALALTEVGYRYQGTGTDFWPKVDETLGVSLTHSDRTDISEVFSRLSQQYGFAIPSRSDWAIAYNHIAWPIRNALAPLEIHKPLLIALGKVLASGTPLREDELLISKLVSIADGLWSRRLRDWLEDNRLAVELSKALLAPDEGEGWFEPSIVARIGNDLRKDPDTAIALRRVKRLVSRERRTSRTSFEASRYGIVIADGRITGLYLNGPLLSDADLQQVASGAAASWEIEVEGAVQSQPIKSFLAGGVIHLGQPMKPLSTAPLSMRSYGERLDDAPSLLSALQPTAPSIFHWNGSDGFFPAAMAAQPISSESKMIYLKWDATDQPLEYEQLPCWDGCSAYLVNPRNKASNNLLRNLGLSPEEIAPITFSGGGTIAISSSAMASLEGLPLYCRVNTPLLTAEVINSDSISLISRPFKKGDVFRLDLAAGSYKLSLDTGDDIQNINISIASQNREASFRIYVDPPSGTIDDLASDALSIILRSEFALHSVEGLAWITQDGHIIDAPFPFQVDVPGRLDASSTLISELKRLVLRSANMGAIDIQIQLKGLGNYTWRLAREYRRLTYMPVKHNWQDEHGTPIAGIKGADISAPLLLVDNSSAKADHDITALWIPATSPWEAISSAVIEAPSVVRMDNHYAADSVSSARAVRGIDGRPGFTTLLLSYLAWRTAEPSNVFASHQASVISGEIEKALVESFCGGEWRRLENSGEGFHRNSYSELARICMGREIATGKRFPQLNKVESANLHVVLTQNFASVFPDLSALLADGAEFEELDYAINDAYAKLSQERELAGATAFEELDIFNSDQTWQKAVRDAVAAAKRPAFQPLILPSSRWKALSSFRYQNGGLDDVVEQLVVCHMDALRSAGKQWIGSREIRIGLQLWMSPRDILKMPNAEEALIKLLSDRQTSRAIRYAALRIRSEKSGS